VTDVAAPPAVGDLLRTWRQRRRLSQLDLSNETGVSARHLSFLETGRSRPSREMVLHLAEQLEVPLRARNELLVAAGFAPVYGERPLDAPAMAAVRAALERVAGNRGVPLLTEGADPALLTPPVNVLRLSLHPDGMARRIRNLAQWRTHVLHRLAREVRLSGDPGLAALHRELAALPGGTDPRPPDGIAVPLRIRTALGELAFLGTVTTFGTAVDVTAAEVSIEAFLPADEATAAALR
jgi:transcriptional regulator with XRE-family HTH domain